MSLNDVSLFSAKGSLIMQAPDGSWPRLIRNAMSTKKGAK